MDDALYPPRSVQGFYKKAELELLVQRRTPRGRLAGTEIDATGAGKTRTVIALANLPIRANWAKLVLFLADAPRW